MRCLIHNWTWLSGQADARSDNLTGSGKRCSFIKRYKFERPKPVSERTELSLKRRSGFDISDTSCVNGVRKNGSKYWFDEFTESENPLFLVIYEQYRA
jgi:hypothetical protein